MLRVETIMLLDPNQSKHDDVNAGNDSSTTDKELGHTSQQMLI